MYWPVHIAGDIYLLKMGSALGAPTNAIATLKVRDWCLWADSVTIPQVRKVAGQLVRLGVNLIAVFALDKGCSQG